MTVIAPNSEEKPPFVFYVWIFEGYVIENCILQSIECVPKYRLIELKGRVKEALGVLGVVVVEVLVVSGCLCVCVWC